MAVFVAVGNRQPEKHLEIYSSGIRVTKGFFFFLKFVGLPNQMSEALKLWLKEDKKRYRRYQSQRFILDRI